MEESTANIDMKTEEKIQKGLHSEILLFIWNII